MDLFRVSLALEVTLLHRTKRRVELSEAGSVFLDHARRILRSTEAAALEAQRAQRGQIGQLAVGFFEHMSYTLLPPIYKAFRARFPLVELDLRWFPVIKQQEALETAQVDVAFMRPVLEASLVNQQVIVREPFVLAVPESHRLAKLRTIPVRACAEEKIIQYASHLAPDFHQMITRMCVSAGFMPTVALEVGQVYTALGLVGAGVGLAFVPQSVQNVRFDHVVYRPISRATPDIEVSLGWIHKNPSAPLLAFLEIAQSVAPRGGLRR